MAEQKKASSSMRTAMIVPDTLMYVWLFDFFEKQKSAWQSSVVGVAVVVVVLVVVVGVVVVTW